MDTGRLINRQFLEFFKKDLVKNEQTEIARKSKVAPIESNEKRGVTGAQYNSPRFELINSEQPSQQQRREFISLMEWSIDAVKW